MKTINQVIGESRKSFDDKFILAADRVTGLGDRVPSYLSGTKIKDFIFTEYTTSLLKAVEEMCEGMMIKKPVDDDTNIKIKRGAYNKALSDVINNIKR